MSESGTESLVDCGERGAEWSPSGTTRSVPGPTAERSSRVSTSDFDASVLDSAVTGPADASLR